MQCFPGCAGGICKAIYLLTGEERAEQERLRAEQAETFIGAGAAASSGWQSDSGHSVLTQMSCLAD